MVSDADIGGPHKSRECGAELPRKCQKSCTGSQLDCGFRIVQEGEIYWYRGLFGILTKLQNLILPRRIVPCLLVGMLVVVIVVVAVVESTHKVLHVIDCVAEAVR